MEKYTNHVEKKTEKDINKVSQYLRVQNRGSSELSSQSFTLSQYFEDGIHFPLEQANSEIEHPISGSLISNLYAAAVPRTSPTIDWVPTVKLNLLQNIFQKLNKLKL